MKNKILLLFVFLLLISLLCSACSNDFDDEISVTEIRILDDDLKHNETWGDYVVIHEDPETGKLEYKIDYKVSPDDATNPAVRIVYDSVAAEERGITVDEDGLVSFTSGGTGMFIKVMLIPEDGSDAVASVTVIALE